MNFVWRMARIPALAALICALSFFAIGTTGAYAQEKKTEHCRTAADDAELVKLETELENLRTHRQVLEHLKHDAEEVLKIAKDDDKYFDEKHPDIDGKWAKHKADLQKGIDDLAALLKEDAARTSEVEARIRVLKAMKPCAPGSETPPPVGPSTATPPVPAHPCRTPEDDKRIDALNVKKAIYQKELSLVNGWIKSLIKSYVKLKQKGDAPLELASVDKQLTSFQNLRFYLEVEIGNLGAQIKALQALKPCPEEPKTTPQPTPQSGEKPPTGGSKTTAPKHPKKPVKHGKRAVTEDNPLYEEHYTPPPSTKTKTHKKSGDDTSGPSRDDADRQTDEPSNDNANQPEIPIPH
ncbi:MAG: hypothetical protein HY243_15795 [Proteobacteria bacterium]|nr:hypothetical protein [Pseudomonadota bacterium]